MSLKTVEIPVTFSDEMRDCDACASRFSEELSSHRGITAVDGAAADSIRVTYDPDLCSLECMEEAANNIGVTTLRRFHHVTASVQGMDCYDCAQTITRAVERIDGVSHVAVNFPAACMRVEYEDTDDRAVIDRVRGRVQGLGYKIRLDDGTEDPVIEHEDRGVLSRYRELAPTAVSAVLLILALVATWVSAPTWVVTALYASSIVVGGLPIARSGVAAFFATRRPDINFLMTVAVIGAAAIGAWLEGALVVVLFSIGEDLEGLAMDRARDSLSKLIQLAPETARVVRDGQESEVTVGEVSVGEQVVVRPGERVPVDGRVVDGRSSVDQAAITGESIPVDKTVGSDVFAGTFNGEGRIFVETTRAVGDTTLARIGRAITEAQAQRSPAERWVDRFARVYTPIVIAVAAITAIVPPLLGAGSFSQWFYRGLAFLILSCPCALVISTPVAVVSALARASAAGVLVKGGAYLEAAAAVTIVAMDKTGTLTRGEPKVKTITTFGTTDEGQALALTAALESASEHPLARAVVDNARERGIAVDKVTDFEAVRGFGVRGVVAGRKLAAGSPRLFAEHPGMSSASTTIEELEAAGQTVILLADDASMLAAFGVADVVRAESEDALRGLRTLGIDQIVLLTGDRQGPASSIAGELGIADVRASLLPADKVDEIVKLGEGGGRVAMVGDGVNDAPALARSSLGIAMGSAGSPTAIETADVALMGDELGKVAGLIGLARWTGSVVRQNIAFSLLVKAAAAVLALTGTLTLWMAVLADVGATLLVVANGLRLLRANPLGSSRNMPILPVGRATLP